MDSLGRAFAMDVACFFFGFGAVFCALSTNIWWLIAARAFAGVSLSLIKRWDILRCADDSSAEEGF